MASASRDLPTAMPDAHPRLTPVSSADSFFLQHPTPEPEDVEEEEQGHEGHCDHDHLHQGLRNRYRKDFDESEQNISIPASSKQAEKTVAPFLAKHIPTQYNPPAARPNQAVHDHADKDPQQPQPNNTKYCYRHHPDLKCRRQANEPSMEQLQNELATLSQSDQQAISHVWSLFSAAPGKHRNMMLQGILTQCCFPQLSYISANVRDLIKIDFLSALPAELGFQILCKLDTASLCKAAQVSRKWRELADDDVVWHKMCEQHIDRKCTKCGWGLPLLERKRLRIEKRQIQLRATGRGLNEWSPAITPIPEEIADDDGTQEDTAPTSTGTKRPLDPQAVSPQLSKRKCMRTNSDSSLTQEAPSSYFESRKRPWKDIYKDRFKVGTAWKYGRCTTKVFRGHTNGVMCLQFDDNVLITGSYDTTVKVWDIESGEELRTLAGHTSGIRCLQFDDNKLMTGSLDHTLRLWNWKTGQCLRTFHAHNDGIISLHFAGRYVATGSMDKTIRVWDSEEKQTFLLRGHTDWVNCVRIDLASRTLFSASDDLKVRLWDLDTRRCIKVFVGHVGQVQQIVPLPAEFELEDDSILPSDKDDDASSVNSSTAHTIHRHNSASGPAAPFWPDDPDRPAPPRYMLTAGLDSTIRLWDVHASEQGTLANQERRDSNDRSDAIPTDPLTNSHLPRAQACIRTFFGHVEGIWALAADHLRFVSGSEDRMMKVWDPRTGKCERTFVGHAAPVTCTWLSDSRLASGSEDCEVRMLTFGEQKS